MNNFNPKRIELENGLVVCMQNTNQETIATRLKIKTGASIEEKEKQGIMHYLEHCVINGGTERFTPEEINKIKCFVGYINADTGWEETNFYTHSLDSDIDLCLDFTSQVAFHPKFDEKILTQEQRRISQEIALHETNPTEKSRRILADAVFPGTILARSLCGTAETLKMFTKQDLVNFHHQYYHTNNAELYIAGNLPGDIEDKIKKYFGDIPHVPTISTPFPIEKHTHEIKILKRERPDLENRSLITIVFPLGEVNLKHPDYESLCILDYLLGRDPNSRLFKTISEDKGLTYDINSGYDPSLNPVFQIYTNTDPLKVNECLDLVFEELGKLRACPVSTEEFIERSGMPYHQILDNITRVTSDDILNVARKYLSEKVPYVVMIEHPPQVIT